MGLPLLVVGQSGISHPFLGFVFQPIGLSLCPDESGVKYGIFHRTEAVAAESFHLQRGREVEVEPHVGVEVERFVIVLFQQHGQRRGELAGCCVAVPSSLRIFMVGESGVLRCRTIKKFLWV